MLVIAIIGPSGSGKDTAAKYLADKNKWNLICSYTTRVPRVGEKEGVEHHFVGTAPRIDEGLMASTMYGGYAYWTYIAQFNSDVNVYVVDEKGLLDIHEQSKKFGFSIIGIGIDANDQTREKRGVSFSRISRDKHRKPMKRKKGFVDIIIKNNKSLQTLHNALDKVAREIKKKINTYEECYETEKRPVQGKKQGITDKHP